jgi:FtsH-binding integral membrane protein
MYATKGQDIEATGDYYSKIGKHQSIDIRHGFIKKVYSIVGIQLVLTTLVALGVSRMASEISSGWVLLALAMHVGLCITIGCFPSTMMKYPTNMILLGLFTITQGFFIGLMSIRYEAKLVLTAAALTAGIVFALSAFAMQTKYDFTGHGSYLFAALLGIFAASLLALFFPNIPQIRILIAGAALIIFCLYLVYDTQLIVGGDHRQFQFDVDDYAFAALAIYIDIVQIFQLILQLLGSFTRD